MSEEDFPLADPQWEAFPCNPNTTRTLMSMGADDSVLIGVGAWRCTNPNCNIAHVAIAAKESAIQIEVGFDAATARDIAAALIQAADRVDPRGSH